MGTRHITIDHEYAEIGAVLETTFFVQNKGSSRIELYIGSTPPDISEEGLTIYPEHTGTTITLQGSELCYAKTEASQGKSTLLIVE